MFNLAILKQNSLVYQYSGTWY